MYGADPGRVEGAVLTQPVRALSRLESEQVDGADSEYELGDLTNLEELDLNHGNELTGRIHRPSWADLTNAGKSWTSATTS